VIRFLYLAVLLCAASPLAAQSFQGVWQGRLTCDAVDGITQAPLAAPFTIRVEGAVAKYERPVLSASGARTGAWERGEGRVGADGALLLQGGSSGRGFHYRARYEGRLGADGVARFTGTQDWMLDDRDFRRQCAVEVRR
jgi:hypothetical protein